LGNSSNHIKHKSNNNVNVGQPIEYYIIYSKVGAIKEAFMQIKTDSGTQSVASNGLGVWGAVGGGLGTLALANQLLSGNGGILNFGNNCQKNQQCDDTRLISALESEIAQLKSERYTDQVGTGVYAEINKKYIELAQFIADMDKRNAVAEAVNAERLGCLSGRVSAIEALTKLVVPNGSVCPGWGNVTITPATTPTA
jgi:hypothetical protein